MPIVALDALLGQPAAGAFLQGVIEQGRPANAYLFQGPSGVGKGTAALAFARALLCENVPGGRAQAHGPGLFETAAPTGPRRDACGLCPGCVKSATLQHPDLRFLFPVSGEERELENTIAETLQAVREQPTFVFQYEKAASIRLSMTREL